MEGPAQDQGGPMQALSAGSYAPRWAGKPNMGLLKSVPGKIIDRDLRNPIAGAEILLRISR